MRDQILTEIRRLAETNGGQPPGLGTFEKETGITRAAWIGKYWARWGDAVKEAGYEPNTAPAKIQEEELLRKFAEAARHYGKIPTVPELRIYGNENPGFPSDSTLAKSFRNKSLLLERLARWIGESGEFTDLSDLIEQKPTTASGQKFSTKEGLVYLIKSGAHYKIGRSDELERRVKEIRIALPEAASLVHSIRTDDPAGIEAYWHRRFADQRANGEWFKLSNADVTAFKKRKFQ